MYRKIVILFTIISFQSFSQEFKNKETEKLLKTSDSIFHKILLNKHDEVLEYFFNPIKASITKESLSQILQIGQKMLSTKWNYEIDEIEINQFPKQFNIQNFYENEILNLTELIFPISDTINFPVGSFITLTFAPEKSHEKIIKMGFFENRVIKPNFAKKSSYLDLDIKNFESIRVYYNGGEPNDFETKSKEIRTKKLRKKNQELKSIIDHLNKLEIHKTEIITEKNFNLFNPKNEYINIDLKTNSEFNFEIFTDKEIQKPNLRIGFNLDSNTIRIKHFSHVNVGYIYILRINNIQELKNKIITFANNWYNK